jgi:hypothetical protein
MQITTLRCRVLAAMLTVLVSLGAISPAHAYSVYRRVAADAVTGIVVWTAANFGVSGDPPTLSFFYYQDDNAARAAMPAAQCFVKVDLGDLVDPQPGDQAAVGDADIPVNANPADQPRPFPWMIEFDNNPPGHWSIARPEITNAVTNAAASRVAAAGFQSLATTVNSGVTVINGTLPNCRAQ